MQMSSKSVSNNFINEHKSVWHLKEIILKNIKKICSILHLFFLKLCSPGT
jgi:hypothetical protein